jgi:hypothetical protein
VAHVGNSIVRAPLLDVGGVDAAAGQLPRSQLSTVPNAEVAVGGGVVRCRLTWSGSSGISCEKVGVDV